MDALREYLESTENEFHTPRQRELRDRLLASYPLPEIVDERIRCFGCGKSVSTPVPQNTIVRAWVECPECMEKRTKEA